MTSWNRYPIFAGIEPANPWPAWLLVLLSVAALVAVAYLYALERRQVTRLTGITLLALRSLAILVVAFMLFQPVDVRQERSVLLPNVVVLVDRSGSMDTTLAYLSEGEKLQIADALGELPESKRPIRLDGKLTRLTRLLQEVDDTFGWLGDESRPIPREKPGLQPLEQAASAADELLQSIRLVTAGGEGWQAKLPDPVRREAVDLSARTESQLVAPLKKLTAMVAQMDNPASLKPQEREKAGKLVTELQKSGKTLASDVLRLSDRLDVAFAEGLDVPSRSILTKIGQMTRKQLAHRLAEARPNSWLAKLEQVPDLNYKPIVRGYEFAGQAVEQNPIKPTTQPAPQESADNLTTDVAGAIQQALADVGQAPLAAVVLLSDGRHNKPGANPETAVQAVAGKSAQVHTVLIGGRTLPPDAAVVELSAPSSVFLKDKLDVQATIKLDGLAGHAVHIRLEQDNQTLAEETLTPAVGEQRLPVTFTVEPERAGRQRYDVLVEPQATEVNRDNNRSSVLVDVVKDHSSVLLADREPRWEYRYLRNLLLRDKQIKLQTVLTGPFRVGGTVRTAPVAAKAGAETVEVDALPEKDEDWLGFDVIILGDLTPVELPENVQRKLVQFVSERGGTLVLIAGRHAMPEGFKGTPLETLLPVTEESQPAGQSLSGISYRLALTPDGETSTAMQLAADRTNNVKTWAGLPRHYWLSPFHVARGGTTVLAFADAAGGPKSSTQPAATQPDDPQTRLERERQNAAVSWRNVGLGRVMFLGLDSTWRFRRRVGDALHHRFWSQLIRWATAERLSAGWKHVKFGCEQPIYQAGEPVTVRARLTNLELTPLSDAELRVNVLADGKQMAGARLTPSASVPGLYEAKIAGLQPGGYVLTLDGPQLVALRDPTNPAETMESLQCGVEVRAGLAVELAELTPNAAAMAQWAGVGHGLALNPGTVSALAEAIRPQPVFVDFSTRTPLWNTWTALLIFAGLITLEWILRKRCGLA